MKKVRLYYIQLLAIVALFFAGCGKDVYTTKLANVDLGNYRSYAWLPSGDTAVNSLEKNPTVAIGVRNTVNSELQKRGYQMNAQNPDFLVLVHTIYEDKVDYNTFPNNYNYFGPGFYTGPWYHGYYPGFNNIGFINGPNVNAVQYTKGTVVVDIIDANTKEVVWRGAASDSIYDNTDVAEEAMEIVQDIFDEYPVKG